MPTPLRALSLAADPSTPGVILAIDYGKKRLGLALSDEFGIASRPFATWTRINRRRDLARLRDLVRKEKIRRIKSIGKTEKEAQQLVAEVDRDRADFIRHYFGKQWPHRPLYNIMINSKFGDEFVIESILQNVEALEKHQALHGVTA